MQVMRAELTAELTKWVLHLGACFARNV